MDQKTLRPEKLNKFTKLVSAFLEFNASACTILGDTVNLSDPLSIASFVETVQTSRNAGLELYSLVLSEGSNILSLLVKFRPSSCGNAASSSVLPAPPPPPPSLEFDQTTIGLNISPTVTTSPPTTESKLSPTTTPSSLRLPVQLRLPVRLRLPQPSSQLKHTKPSIGIDINPAVLSSSSSSSSPPSTLPPLPLHLVTFPFPSAISQEKRRRHPIRKKRSVKSLQVVKPGRTSNSEQRRSLHDNRNTGDDQHENNIEFRTEQSTANIGIGGGLKVSADVHMSGHDGRLENGRNPDSTKNDKPIQQGKAKYVNFQSNWHISMGKKQRMDVPNGDLAKDKEARKPRNMPDGLRGDHDVRMQQERLKKRSRVDEFAQVAELGGHSLFDDIAQGRDDGHKEPVNLSHDGSSTHRRNGNIGVRKLAVDEGSVIVISDSSSESEWGNVRFSRHKRQWTSS